MGLGARLNNGGAGVIHIENSVFIGLVTIGEMLKKQALGIAIVFHGLMKIQVILGNIGQHSTVIFYASHTL